MTARCTKARWQVMQLSGAAIDGGAACGVCGWDDVADTEPRPLATLASVSADTKAAMLNLIKLVTIRASSLDASDRGTRAAVQLSACFKTKASGVAPISCRTQRG